MTFPSQGISPVFNEHISYLSLIEHAVRRGATLVDLSCSPLSVVFDEGVRDKVQIATKLGGPSFIAANAGIQIQAISDQLGVDYVDLVYVDGGDTSVPIEVVVGEVGKLVKEGKIKYIGLYGASVSTIRRAYTVHPVTAVEVEWSLWNRAAEKEIVPICRDLGTRIVARDPWDAGYTVCFDGGKSCIPLHEYNLERDRRERLYEIATSKGCTTSQLSLAWLHNQGTDVVPIPAADMIEKFNENIGALAVHLTFEDMAELEYIASGGETAPPVGGYTPAAPPAGIYPPAWMETLTKILCCLIVCASNCDVCG